MPTIAERLRDEGRDEGIAEGMTKGRNEGIAEGIAKGRNESNWNVVRNLLKKDLSPSAIAELIELPIDRIEELIAKNNRPTQTIGKGAGA
ncbi:MAG: hypothetical protein GY765_29175 [bacterium]|nr:hypothetical protein [bacterium]